MRPRRFGKSWREVIASLGFTAIALLSPDAEAESPSLTEASMTQAADYLGVLAGRDLAPEDEAWLKRQWTEESEKTSQSAAAQVDELAFGLERHRRDQDQLALAQMRATTLTNIYCTSAQTSDPQARRLREILTPDDIVLAADCLLGLVVTRFDADGLVASHGLLASAAGQNHDAEKDKDSVVATIKSDFADATPAEKATLAYGELRHAVLARYWSRIDGTQEQRDFLDAIRGQDLGNFRSPARQFEDLAFDQLGDVDYLAKAGGLRLEASAIGTYRTWLETIAGRSFSTRTLDWLQQAIIDGFLENPEKIDGEIRGLKEMNRDYILAESGFRQDPGHTKRELVDGWASALYCHAIGSSDPDERRLIDMVFHHDPVVEADCAAMKVKRKSHQIIAEADGAQLFEHDLDVSQRFASMMLARPLLPEEELIVREDNIQSFRKDPEAWRQNHGHYQNLLADIEGKDSDFFLAMNNRKKLFDPIYCALKESSDPYADDYVDMFQRYGAIVHEDCDQQLVTTRDEIDAFIGIINFLAMLNGRQPFDEAETEELRQSLASENIDITENYLLALQEWWSLLSPEEKIAEARYVRDEGITPDADASKLKFFINSVQAKLVGMNSMRKACLVDQVITQGQVAQFAARAGGFLMGPGGGELGIPDSELPNIVHSATLGSGLCGEFAKMFTRRSKSDKE